MTNRVDTKLDPSIGTPEFTNFLRRYQLVQQREGRTIRVRPSGYQTLIIIA